MMTGSLLVRTGSGLLVAIIALQPNIALQANKGHHSVWYLLACKPAQTSATCHESRSLADKM